MAAGWVNASRSGLASATLNFGPGFNLNGSTVTYALDDPSNMVFDPGFEDTPALQQWNQLVPGAFTRSNTIFYQGLYSAQTSTAGSYLYQTFYCTPFDQFVAAVAVRSSAGATGTATISIIYYDNTGALITYNPYTSIGPGTSFASCLLPDTVVPSNAATMRLIIRMDPGATGTWYFDNVTLRRLAKGNNIEVGSILSSHLTAGSLGDLSKYSSTVRAVGIESGLPTLPSANFPAGSIIFNLFDGKLYRTADGVSWGKSVDPQDLIAGTLAAGVIYAGVIQTSQINTGTLVAGVIYAGPIYATQIQASGDIEGVGLGLTRNNVTITINNGYNAIGGYYYPIQMTAGFNSNLMVISESQIASFANSIAYFNLQNNGVFGQGSLSLQGAAPYIAIGGNNVLSGRRTGPGYPTFTTVAGALTWCQSIFTAFSAAYGGHGMIA